MNLRFYNLILKRKIYREAKELPAKKKTIQSQKN